MKKIEPKDMTLKTLSHYALNPQGFWQGTKDHDVNQNIDALLSNIDKKGPLKILDFGCGPGRDLKVFSELGHTAYGLDGLEAFCQMARDYSGCEVFQQDFIEVKLEGSF
jgi:SAM-dependent methyltransferase